jgi:hypothetical protein
MVTAVCVAGATCVADKTRDISTSYSLTQVFYLCNITLNQMIFTLYI